MPQENVFSQPQETPAAQAADTQEPKPPTVTIFQEQAAKASKVLDDLTAEIPGYHDDLSIEGLLARRVAPPEFVDRAVSVIENVGPLSPDDVNYVTDTRTDQQFNEAFKPFLKQVLGFADRLGLMTRVKDARAGRGALRIYHMAKRLAKNPNNAQLLVHVEGLRLSIRRRKSKRAAPASPKKGGAIAA